jgi:hypothetical protein
MEKFVNNSEESDIELGLSVISFETNKPEEAILQVENYLRILLFN